MAKLVSIMALVVVAAGCSGVYYAQDVLLGNRQGQACYLKCWSRGYDECNLDGNPMENYKYDPRESVKTLTDRYKCSNESPIALW